LIIKKEPKDGASMRRSFHGSQFYIFLPFFLIVFAVPYLFDLAFCEELYATPLSQAAFIDGELVEPYESEFSSSGLDSTETGAETVLLANEGVSLQSDSIGSISPALFPIVLTSRPPPVR
jgi:hypothetical protein